MVGIALRLRAGLAGIICVSMLTAAPAVAQSNWGQIGYGRLINNDFLGDLQDREQSGSYVSSRMYAREWKDSAPVRPFEVLEFRLQADIKTPDDLRTPRAGDRLFAGSVTAGLHTHYQSFGYDIALGAELVATGPQTRLDQFQTALHDALGVTPPSAGVRNNQIGNQFFPGVVAEMSKPFGLGSRGEVRPFVEGRAGVETLFRVGVDLAFGDVATEDLMVRDGITGQRYRTLRKDTKGLGFVLGFDTAMVSESAYLPAASGYTLTDLRHRVRTGLHWQNDTTFGFFGVTYLGEEYSTQTDPQVVGSIRLSLRF